MVFGVGVNDVGYEVLDCPFYSIWTGMLQRCYYKPVKHCYTGCSVSPEWLVFSVFKTWMEHQPWEGNFLDKDIIEIGNKIYGPSTCAFVSQDVNNVLIDSKRKRGRYSRGVSFEESKNKYRARCNIGWHRHHIGRYSNMKDASNAYLDFKVGYIEELSMCQEDVRVQEGLLRHAENMIKEEAAWLEAQNLA